MNGLRSADYNVYSTFQSHEPEFDYLKSLEIEEKINKIRWLKQCNSAHFLLSTNGKFWMFLLNYDMCAIGCRCDFVFPESGCRNLVFYANMFGALNFVPVTCYRYIGI